MELLLLQAQKAARRSLYSEQDASIPDFEHGETVPVTVGLIRDIATPLGSRIYDPQDLTGWTFRAALGRGFLPPVAGVYTLSFDGDTTPALSTLPPDAGEIADALNSLASMVAAGGVEVTEENGLLFFTFNTPGDYPAISGNAENLAPLSIMDFGTLISGNDAAGIQEVQTLRIVQNPATFCSLTIANNPASANVAVLRVGGGGFNHKIRVLFSPLPYDGKWTLNVGGSETALIDYAAAEGDVVAALESLPSVGAGNVQSFKEAEGSYLIAFAGDLADTDMGEISADASALRVVSTLSGTLDLRTPGIDLLLGGQDSTQCYFEVEGTPPDGTPLKFFRELVTLLDSIIDPSDTTPQPYESYLTAAQSNARFRRSFVAVPAGAGAAGNAGDEAYDADYRYICVAANTWKRAAHATF